MFNKKLLKEIEEYCQLNGIVDVSQEINNMLRTGFYIVKYGTSPFEQMEKQSATTAKTNTLSSQLDESIVKPKRGRKKKVNEENMTTSLENENVESNVEIEDKPKKKMRIIKNS